MTLADPGTLRAVGFVRSGRGEVVVHLPGVSGDGTGRHHFPAAAGQRAVDYVRDCVAEVIAEQAERVGGWAARPHRVVLIPQERGVYQFTVWSRT